MSPRRAFDARIAWLLVAAGICYAIGYPLALVWHSNAGWVLVFLGGPFLLAAGALTVRWLHRGAERTRSTTGTEPEAHRAD